jgi:hypothetical protein
MKALALGRLPRSGARERQRAGARIARFACKVRLFYSPDVTATTSAVLCATTVLFVSGCGSAGAGSSEPSEAAAPRTQTPLLQTSVDTQAIGFALDRYLAAVNFLVLSGRDCLVQTTNAASRRLCVRTATPDLDESGGVIRQLVDEAARQAQGSCAEQLRTVNRRFLATTNALVPLTRAMRTGEGSRVTERLRDLHRGLTRVRSALTRAAELC